MDTQERRQAVLHVLEQASGPVNATILANRYGVSRQIIVGDIALLRASGADITATPRGYLLPHTGAGLRRTLACRHGADGAQDELNALVDQGCTVVDVIVEHPVYGQITAPLQLANRYDVEQFIQRTRQHGAPPLSQLTDGVHLHTVLCPDEAAFLRAREALAKLGVLLEE